MKYFLHDTNAFMDEKITELYINFGYEGLGIYYTLLEKLALQEKPIKTLVLKKQLNIGKKLNKCWNFMESLGIISSNNDETFSKTLLNFSEKYEIKKQKNKKRIAEWRKNQVVGKNVTCYESVRNSPKVNRSKVNRSKGKESKENNIKNHLFKNSVYYDFELLKKNIGEKYQQYDLGYYYESMINYSESKGKMYKNWLAACRAWINRDIGDGKIKLKTFQNKKITAEEQSIYIKY